MKKLALLLLLASPAFSAIGVDGASSSGGAASGAGPFTFSHTVTSNTNGYLQCNAGYFAGSGQTITGITYNSVAMTFIQRQNNSANAGYTTEGWYLKTPSTGANTVSVSVSASLNGTFDKIMIACESLTGADQTSPIDVSVKQTGTSQSPSLSFTTTSNNDYSIGSYIQNQGNDTPLGTAPSGETLIARFNSGSPYDGSMLYKPTLATGSNSMNWTTGNAFNWSIVVTAVRPAAPATTGNFFQVFP